MSFQQGGRRAWAQSFQFSRFVSHVRYLPYAFSVFTYIGGCCFIFILRMNDTKLSLT